MKKMRSAGDRIFDVFNYCFLSVLSMVALYPLIYVFSMSISSEEAVKTNAVRLWPVGFSLTSFGKAIRTDGLGLAYYNTVVYVIIGTTLSILVTMMFAYALSRPKFVLRRGLSVYIIITMLFSGGLIPLFMVIRTLGIYNTRWAVILPALSSVWNLIISRVFIQQNISESLIESAYIDGYNDIGIFARIVMPLSKQIIAIIGLYQAVYFWNQYFQSMIFAPDKRIAPLQIILIEILLRNSMQSQAQQLGDAQAIANQLLYMLQAKYVIILMSILPIIMVYPFIQKYFVKGVMIGSVKE